LEYISRFYGVHVELDELYWGALGRAGHEICYTQHWDGDVYREETSKDAVSGFINEREIFRLSNGLRAVTGWDGGVKRLINISGAPLRAEFLIDHREGAVPLEPNEVYVLK
jgi:hypothetical protein